MNKQDLMKFCEGSLSPKYREPWSVGEYTLATDGKIIVRVSRLSDVPENTEAVNALQLFERVKNTEYGWHDIPHCTRPEPLDCPLCGGHGTIECDRCFGSGVRKYFNEKAELAETVSCVSCEGEGSWDCPDCGGDGKIEPMVKIPVGNLFFQSKYLALLLEIGCKQIGTEKPESPAYFKFEGGDGMLMPVKD